MKMFKKITALMLLVGLCLSQTNTFPLIAEVEPETITESAFVYKIDGVEFDIRNNVAPVNFNYSTSLDEPAMTEDILYNNFKTPHNDTKPAPLWFWNREVEDMTTDEVRTIVRESYEQSGYNGFGILPQWQSDYFSDKYFELYRAALEEGHKYGMKFSIYDENGFPSYNAGGMLEELYPDLTTKRIDKIESSGKNGDHVRLHLPEGKVLGAVAMNIDTNERIDISDKAIYIEPKPYTPVDEPLGVSASTTYSVTSGYESEKAVDGDFTTRWNSESYSGGKQYLQIKFEDKETFDTVKVYEDVNPKLHRSAEYYIRYWDYEQNKWIDVASGKKITDKGVSHTFEPVTSDIVRLYIKKVNEDSASISEFQVFNNNVQLSVPKTPIIETPGYSASSIYSKDYSAEKAFDGDVGTRWNAGDGTAPPHWLQVDYGSMRTVDRVVLHEYLDRIKTFQVQYWTGSEWKTCAEGNSNPDSTTELIFEPIQTSKIRLYMPATSNIPTLWDVEFYNGNQKLVIDDDAEKPWEGSYLEYDVPQGNWKVMAFMCVVDGNDGMDYLDPASVRAFIDITYERYFEEFGEYFENGTITSAFYDEPSFWPAGGRTPYGAKGARFWTTGFNEEYLKFYPDGNPVLDYPALWYDIGEETDQARNRMQYVRTEMFANNYIGQIDDWCADHGIELTGHMLFEQWINPVGVHGDLMKVFKNQAIPGIDVIDGYGNTQEAYKIISSAAYNWDKGRVMSESFGVFPSSNVTDLYKSAMDQYAKGINIIIPHAVWYDNDPSYVTYKPELSYRNPQFADDLPALNEYIGRLNTLMQNGKHVADIAMLYPIDYLESSFIFNETANNPSDADYMQVGETLSLVSRRDFTYLHPDVIDDKCTVDGNTLKLNNEINNEEYKVFIIPGTKVISLDNLKKIKEFYDAGGIVISTTQLPSRATTLGDNAEVSSIIKEIFGVDALTNSDAENSNESGGQAYFIKTEYKTKLTSILDKALSVYDVKINTAPSISRGNLSYIHKVKEGRNIYFFANSSDTKVDTTVSLRGNFENLMIWDPITGESVKADSNVINTNGADVTNVSISLPAVGSLFIVEPAEETPVIGLNVTANLVPAENKAIVTVRVEDDSEISSPITVITSAYDKSGRMISYDSKNVDVKGIDTFELNLSNYTDESNVKVFVCSQKDMKPLLEYIILP